MSPKNHPLPSPKLSGPILHIRQTSNHELPAKNQEAALGPLRIATSYDNFQPDSFIFALEIQTRCT